MDAYYAVAAIQRNRLSEFEKRAMPFFMAEEHHGYYGDVYRDCPEMRFLVVEFGLAEPLPGTGEPLSAPL